MTEPADAATKDAYEGAIRSFTEAEIALREIVAGLQRFRAASESIAEAGSTLAEAREAVVGSAQVLDAAGVALTTISGSLISATAVIAGLDPSRFWASFAQLEVATSAAAASTQKIGVQVAAASKSLHAAERTAVDKVTANIGEVREIATQAHDLAAVSVILGVVIVILEVVLLLR